ncbi:MAG: hypothetical protein ACJASQ_000566 [Crocinitomicaceae bacterium]|jgi:hypothetical protein
MSETNLAFSFKDQDFMDFLPEDQLDQLRSRWTDFNIHDPGVTTLEALRFSLEDLRYRFELDIKDKLQSEEKSALSTWGKKHFRPRYAVSSDDYRRLIARNKGIINNMVYASTDPNTLPNTEQLKCLVNVDIASNRDIDLLEAQRHVLNRRPLGEYVNRQKGFDTVLREKVVPVDVKLSVTFVPGAETDANIQLLREAIKDYILPELTTVNSRFTSIRKLMNDRDQLGPIGNGAIRNLIDPESMAKTCYRRYISVAELLEVTQQLSFVLTTNSIEIGITRDDFKKSVLDLGEESFARLQNITINKVLLAPEIHVDEEEEMKPWDVYSTKGTYKKMGEFNSIQLSFPPNYKIGTYLKHKRSMTPTDKGNIETNSFRGYLYFMDKVRADISAQMENFHNVFEMDGDSSKIGEMDISQTSFYKDMFPLEIDGFTPSSEVVVIETHGSETEERYNNERINYLLALNGWAIVDVIPSRNNDVSLLQIKLDFLKLIRMGARRSDRINGHLNRIFRATSLVMLQRKIEVILQNDVTDVRIMEHCFFQPVWQGLEDFNFEITMFLFPKINKNGNRDCDDSMEDVVQFSKQLIRAFVPAHIAVNIQWVNDDIRSYDGYLQTAFPPEEIFYFDQALTQGQEYAMKYILSNWLGIKA